jgi:hypothetical protein
MKETKPRAYRGRRTAAGPLVEVERPDGTWEALPPRFELRKHSPSGFEWGGAGAGASQLALALAASRLLDEEALAVYPVVKSIVVARLEYAGWELSGAELDAYLAEVVRELRRRSREIPHLKPEDESE